MIVDEDYARYYDQMLDEMIAQGIEPMICLEHYEIPGELFKNMMVLRVNMLLICL